MRRLFLEKPALLRIINPRANPRPKAVLFDLDGTLVNTLKLQETAFGKLHYWITNAKSSEPSGKDLIPGKEFLHRTMGKISTDQMSMMLDEARFNGLTERLGKVLGELAIRYKIEERATKAGNNMTLGFAMIYEAVVLQMIRENPPELLPGVSDLIKYLWTKGISINIGTGTVRSAAEEIMTQLRIAHYFDAIYGATFDEEPPFPNGKADMLRKIAREGALRENEVLMFGDGKGDMEASKFDGRRFIGIGLSGSDAPLEKKLIEGGADFLIPDLTKWRSYVRFLGFPK